MIVLTSTMWITSVITVMVRIISAYCHVPLIIADPSPRQTQPEAPDATRWSTIIDLAATFIEMAGGDVRDIRSKAARFFRSCTAPRR